MEERLSDKQKIEGSIPSLCIALVPIHLGASSLLAIGIASLKLKPTRSDQDRSQHQHYFKHHFQGEEVGSIPAQRIFFLQYYMVEESIHQHPSKPTQIVKKKRKRKKDKYTNKNNTTDLQYRNTILYRDTAHL